MYHGQHAVLNHDSTQHAVHDTFDVCVPDTTSGNQKSLVPSRPVMKVRQNGVADEPRRPQLDTVHRQGMTVQKVSK